MIDPTLVRFCKRLLRSLTIFTLFVQALPGAGFVVAAQRESPASTKQIELGQYLFQDKFLSRDGKTSCESCHDPRYAYGDSKPRGVGTDGRVGTRNAPSLRGVGDDEAFFWDGRRTRLEDVVLDPFTNPIELGLSSRDELTDKLHRQPGMQERFKLAFPQASTTPTIEQASVALVAFVRSLRTGTSAFDRAGTLGNALPADAELGRHLFEGVAACSKCHSTSGVSPRLTDGQYHHSGIGQATQSPNLPALTQTVLRENLGPAALGPKVLTNPDWSSLGRFVVSHQPADIGAFRTPSLRNVAVTAPYMHDGSIATLSQVVDHEIYYRGFSSGHPINLTQAERQAVVAFLEALTDAPQTSGMAKH